MSTEEALQPISEETTNLLVENRRRFKQFLTKRLSNEADAEEILQQSLRKVMERPPSSDERESVLAWFFEVLRNAVTDHYRRGASEKRKHEELKQNQLAQGEPVQTPDLGLEDGVCECLKGLLPALKPEYADLLQRIDLGEESVEKVAADLGVTRNNLDVRLHRARKALKVSLERACGSCSEHGCLNCSCG
jgi:RNA polymerase sigma factor (sigma-70 family)